MVKRKVIEEKIPMDEMIETNSNPNDDVSLPHQPLKKRSLFFDFEEDEEEEKDCIFCKKNLDESIEFFIANIGTVELNYLLETTLEKIKEIVAADETFEPAGFVFTKTALFEHVTNCLNKNNLAVEISEQLRCLKKIRNMMLDDSVIITKDVNGIESREFDLKNLTFLEKLNCRIITLYKELTN